MPPVYKIKMLQYLLLFAIDLLYLLKVFRDFCFTIADMHRLLQ